MPSRALEVFLAQISECRDVLTIFDYLESKSKYSADFGLRFVWIAAISALDHYVTNLIVEVATIQFSNNHPLSAKLKSELIPLSAALEVRSSDPVTAILKFNKLIKLIVGYRSFQSDVKISDGLAIVWTENHKWQKIAAKLGKDQQVIKDQLGAIVERRNLIAHNADFDDASNEKMPICKADASEVVVFVIALVRAIDDLVAH